MDVVTIGLAVLVLGLLRVDDFEQDIFHCFGVGLDGTAEWVASQGAEAHFFDLDFFIRLQAATFVINHHDHLRAHYYRAVLGKIQWHNRDVLLVDILPDIELGPIGEWKHTYVFVPVLASVVQVPDFRTLALWALVVIGGADRKYLFLGAESFFIAATPTQDHVEPVMLQRLLEAFGLDDLDVLGRVVVKGVDVFFERMRISVYQ